MKGKTIFKFLVIVLVLSMALSACAPPPLPQPKPPLLKLKPLLPCSTSSGDLLRLPTASCSMRSKLRIQRYGSRFYPNRS